MTGVDLEAVTDDTDIVAPDIDPLDGTARPQLGAGILRDPDQLGRHRPHPADGHAPLAGAVAHPMEQETPVLHERRVVQGCERADQPVGADHPAHEVVRKAPLQCDAEGLLDDVGPRDHVDGVSQVADVGEWLQQRGGHGAGEAFHVGVERTPGLELGIRTRQRPE
jgi:hypothetical protein